MDFAEIFELERTAKISKKCVPISDDPVRARRSAEADVQRVTDIVLSLSLEDLKAYGEYRSSRIDELRF